MAELESGVAVVIAAHNAAPTIGRAIASALAEPEVREIVVVDDASTDATADVAARGEDGSGRLRVERLAANQGPSAARNRALALSSAGFVAILDADDFILPGRFARLLAEADWDLVADNIVFVPEASVSSFAVSNVPAFAPDPRPLTLNGFIAGNISERGKKRGELGFLKPVIRRAFLERFGLRYDESMRLGEDYDLYCRAMVLGARFRLISSCGYGAVERPGSLSGLHRTEDLEALAAGDARLLADPALPAASRSILRRHQSALWRKVWLRRFLDTKRAGGMASALRYAAATPERFLSIARDVALDKWEARAGSRAPEARSVRYLLEGQPVG